MRFTILMYLLLTLTSVAHAQDAEESSGDRFITKRSEMRSIQNSLLIEIEEFDDKFACQTTRQNSQNNNPGMYRHGGFESVTLSAVKNSNGISVVSQPQTAVTSIQNYDNVRRAQVTFYSSNGSDVDRIQISLQTKEMVNEGTLISPRIEYQYESYETAECRLKHSSNRY